MRHQIEKLIRDALAALESSDLADAIPDDIVVERTRDPRHGDFACNVAMVMAKAARTNPRELAAKIIDALPSSELIDRAEIAGPGFINFHLTSSARYAVIKQILDKTEHFGRSNIAKDLPVIVEFISANPTGPLHVGHGRHAAYGASVANLLAATGHKVHREYYVNDAGRQIDILTLSLWLRYLEQAGEQIEFPNNAYRGDYIIDIAAVIANEHGNTLVRPAVEVYRDIPPDADGGSKEEKQASEQRIDALIGRCKELLGAEGYRQVADIALASVLEDIREDLEEFGVQPDRWFSELEMVRQGSVKRVLAELEKNGDLFEKDGATWFRSSAYGDEKDRVIVRENGQATYIASDIAYHLDKRKRGFELLLDVLGADHHGYVARVRAGLAAANEPADSLEVRLVQFVSLYRDGKKAQMSTRSGQFVTLRELRSDVGNDAARLFYVMRSNDQHLNFDVDLAKSRTEENPVYYIQYAHARVCSVFRQLTEKEIDWDQSRGAANLERLQEKQETELIAELDRYCDIVELSAVNRAPHHLVHYLRSVANLFHTYYNASRFILDDDPALRDARLALATATQQVIRNGLGLLGVDAPETM